jgi:hypothetical protein
MRRQKLKKHPGAALPISRSKREIALFKTSASEFNSFDTSFSRKKYCIHDNAKLVFLKINIQKLYTLKKSNLNSATELHCLRAQCK